MVQIENINLKNQIENFEQTTKNNFLNKNVIERKKNRRQKNLKSSNELSSILNFLFLRTTSNSYTTFESFSLKMNLKSTQIDNSLTRKKLLSCSFE